MLNLVLWRDRGAAAAVQGGVLRALLDTFELCEGAVLPHAAPALLHTVTQQHCTMSSGYCVHCLHRCSLHACGQIPSLPECCIRCSRCTRIIATSSADIPDYAFPWSGQSLMKSTACPVMLGAMGLPI